MRPRFNKQCCSDLQAAAAATVPGRGWAGPPHWPACPRTPRRRFRPPPWWWPAPCPTPGSEQIYIVLYLHQLQYLGMVTSTVSDTRFWVDILCIISTRFRYGNQDTKFCVDMLLYLHTISTISTLYLRGASVVAPIPAGHAADLNITEIYIHYTLWRLLPYYIYYLLSIHAPAAQSSTRSRPRWHSSPSAVCSWSWFDCGTWLT